MSQIPPEREWITETFGNLDALKVPAKPKMEDWIKARCAEGYVIDHINTNSRFDKIVVMRLRPKEMAT